MIELLFCSFRQGRDSRFDWMSRVLAIIELLSQRADVRKMLNSRVPGENGEWRELGDNEKREELAQVKKRSTICLASFSFKYSYGCCPRYTAILQACADSAVDVHEEETLGGNDVHAIYLSQ